MFGFCREERGDRDVVCGHLASGCGLGHTPWENHGICDMRNVRAPRQHSLRGCGEQLLGTARAKEGPTEGSGCKSLPSPAASVPCSQNMFSERGITLRASGCLKSLFSGEKCQEIMVKNKN